LPSLFGIRRILPGAAVTIRYAPRHFVFCVRGCGARSSKNAPSPPRKAADAYKPNADPAQPALLASLSIAKNGEQSQTDEIDKILKAALTTITA
jgi:hypothetical protein